MEDKRSIKKVMESQGDVHEKVANQSNLELPISSPTRSPGPPRIHAKEIAFPMELVSCPTKIRVVRNHQNSTDFHNRFWCCATILARWAVYPVGVH
jgi:hypothetical protein